MNMQPHQATRTLSTASSATLTSSTCRPRVGALVALRAKSERDPLDPCPLKFCQPRPLLPIHGATRFHYSRSGEWPSRLTRLQPALQRFSRPPAHVKRRHTGAPFRGHRTAAAGGARGTTSSHRTQRLAPPARRRSSARSAGGEWGGGASRDSINESVRAYRPWRGMRQEVRSAK